ncbi:MAG: type IV secretion system protein, partial [Caldimonas sp.]
MTTRNLIRRIAAATLLSIDASAHAQGIPVIDIANLVQTIQQVMNDITEISNQVEQISQLQAQVSSM